MIIEITNDTPPEPSSHIVFTFTSAISSPVTTCMRKILYQCIILIFYAALFHFFYQSMQQCFTLLPIYENDMNYAAIFRLVKQVTGSKLHLLVI